MGSERPKQYLPLAGKSLIEHALAPLLSAPWIAGVMVVLPAGDSLFAQLAVAKDPRVKTIAGGPTRAGSVLAGLRAVAAIAGEQCTVLVHDAARPCVTREELERLRDAARGDAGGLLALPMSDTVKRAEGEHSAATIDRRELWRAQTPQLFRLGVLRAALESAQARGLEITDEASAMEAAGHRPRLVRGRESNIKVTYPGDLALAEYWLARNASLA